MKTRTAKCDPFFGRYNEVKPGDTIILDYGCGCGSDRGKAYGKEQDNWGGHIRVKVADGQHVHFESVTSFTGVGYGDYKGVGAYWIPDSPLRQREERSFVQGWREVGIRP